MVRKGKSPRLEHYDREQSMNPDLESAPYPHMVELAKGLQGVDPARRLRGRPIRALL